MQDPTNGSLDAGQNNTGSRDEEKAMQDSQEKTSAGQIQTVAAPSLAPKYSCGFLDPRLKPLRIIYLKVVGVGTFLSVVAILAIMSIYWGALFSVTDKVPGLNGYIVDFDGGEIGQLVTSSFLTQSGSFGQMTWALVSYPDVDAVAEAVRENQAWAAVIVNGGATANLQSATSSADGSYNGSLAITVQTNQARNQNAYSYIQTAYTTVLTNVTRTYAAQRARELATSSSLATLLSQAPSVVTLPISYTVDSLLPFDSTAAIATTFVGLIYVTIFAFTLTLQAANGRAPIEPYLNLQSLLVLRLLTPLIGYVLLSWAYAILNYAFQIPFDRKFGDRGWVIFWCLCYVAMVGLGLALEAMITLLTPKFISFFLLLWIIGQVAVAQYPIEMLPQVYRYGYSTIYLNFSEATRCIVFSTKNKVGQNFGILFAWVVVSLCTMTLFTTFMFRRAKRAAYARQ